MSKQSKHIIGMGLESSCDETSVSIVENGNNILSNVIYSQIDLHKEYYGVVPEIASRAHLETVNILSEQALKEAHVTFDDLDYVAATNRPGLVGSLLISHQSAKAVSYACGIPLIAINHLEAHLYAPFLEGHELHYPFLGLLVSGGNTVLYHVNGLNDMTVIGRTVDDAVGEAFDKVARFLDIGYPGGPAIEKLALNARSKDIRFPKILPKPGDLRFSYSGLKTAVINYVKNNPDTDPAEIAYAFQESAVEVLVRRTIMTLDQYETDAIVVAGGVAANTRLRESLQQAVGNRHKIIIASPLLCTDNAAMVAGLAYQYFINKQFDDLTSDVYARISM